MADKKDDAPDPQTDAGKVTLTQEELDDKIKAAAEAAAAAAVKAEREARKKKARMLTTG